MLRACLMVGSLHISIPCDAISFVATILTSRLRLSSAHLCLHRWQPELANISAAVAFSRFDIDSPEEGTALQLDGCCTATSSPFTSADGVELILAAAPSWAALHQVLPKVFQICTLADLLLQATLCLSPAVSSHEPPSSSMLVFCPI